MENGRPSPRDPNVIAQLRKLESDHVAFAECAYIAYGGLVRGYIHRKLERDGIVGDSQATAEDLKQETFLRFFLTLPIKDSAYTLPYLLRTPRNHIIDLYRRSTIVRQESLEALTAPTESSDENWLTAKMASPDFTQEIDRQEFVQMMLSSLKPRDRQILQLHYRDGLDFEEIAQRLGKKPGTVKMQCHRTIALLRGLYGDSDMVDPPHPQ